MSRVTMCLCVVFWVSMGLATPGMAADIPVDVECSDSYSILKGDMDGDGVINVADILMSVQVALGLVDYAEYVIYCNGSVPLVDTDGDGVPDDKDIDDDGDGMLDSEDCAPLDSTIALLDECNVCGGDGSSCAFVDTDGDGVISKVETLHCCIDDTSSPCVTSTG